MGNIFGKNGLEQDVLAWLIIAVAVLVLVGFGYMIFSGKLSGIASQLKNLFGFWG